MPKCLDCGKVVNRYLHEVLNGNCKACHKKLVQEIEREIEKDYIESLDKDYEVIQLYGNERQLSKK